jgi:hypothetical protein
LREFSDPRRIISGQARRTDASRTRESMSLTTVLLIGLAAWISILVVVLAMCRAAAHAEGKLERVDPAPTPTAKDAPARASILASHR